MHFTEGLNIEPEGDILVVIIHSQKSIHNFWGYPFTLEDVITLIM